MNNKIYLGKISIEDYASFNGTYDFDLRDENGLIYLTSNLSSNANSLMSVNRTFIANSQVDYNQVKLYGAVGSQYILPQLTTEDGIVITTEDGKVLLIG